jgi:hypothetical protein
MLIPEHKEPQMTLAGDLITVTDEGATILNDIIAGDETMCFLYDRKPKRQWKSKSSPEKQKFDLEKNKSKVKLEICFDAQSIVHYKFIP